MASRATASVAVSASPEQVAAVACTPGLIEQWWPLGLRITGASPDRQLVTGQSTSARASLAGREFDVTIRVLHADGRRLYLVADGPLVFEIAAAVADGADGGVEIDATVTARSGGGLAGRVLQTSAGPLLAPGLRHALETIRALAEQGAAAKRPGPPHLVGT